MLGIVYIITILVALGSSQPYYPNCLQSLTNTSQTYNFNTKLIKLTEFLFTTATPAETQSIPSSVSVIDSQYWLTYMILLGSVSGVAFVTLVLRVKGSYYQKLRMFVGKGAGGVVGPGVVVLALLFILFIGGAAVGVIRVLKHVGQADCQARHTRELLLRGDNSSNWAGLQGFQKVINLQVAYINAITSMTSAYSSSISPLVNRKKSLSQSPNQLLALYSQSKIQIENPQTTLMEQFDLKILFPELFDPANYEWMNGIVKIIDKFVKVSDLIVGIEINGIDVKLNTQSSSSLAKKVTEFLMLAKVASNSEALSIDWQSYIKSNQSALMVFSIYIALGLQASFSFLLLVLVSCQVKHTLIIKMTNLLWVLLMVELILCTIVLYNLTGISSTLNQQCPTLTKMLTNGTYYLLYANTTAKSTTQYNLYKQLHPCLFGNGTFNDLTAYQADSVSMVNLMTYLRTYIRMMDPTHVDFADMYSYTSYYDTLVAQIQSRKYSNKGAHSWQYISDLLTTLNNYTLNDALNSKCYKHRWANEISECGQGENVLPATGNSLLIASANYSSAKVSCMLLSRSDNTGRMRTLAYVELITNYMGDTNQTRCSSTITQILGTLLSLSNAIQVKQAPIQSIIDSLLAQKQSLDQYLRLIRTDYMLKKQEYQYILTRGNSIPVGDQTYNNYSYAIKEQSNCTPVKQYLSGLHDSVCINGRAQLMRSYFFVIVAELCLAGLVALGALYGVDQEMREIQRLFYEQEEAESVRQDQERQTFSEVYRRKNLMGKLVNKVIGQKKD